MLFTFTLGVRIVLFLSTHPYMIPYGEQRQMIFKVNLKIYFSHSSNPKFVSQKLFSLSIRLCVCVFISRLIEWTNLNKTWNLA